jgi:hypothetical protein
MYFVFMGIGLYHAPEPAQHVKVSAAVHHLKKPFICMGLDNLNTGEHR